MSIILIALIIIFALFFLRKYLRGGQCKSKHSMEGKVVIITGASSGIGKESAIDLVKHGARVILACRNEKKTKKAMESLNEQEKKLIHYIRLDLSDFNSIIEFVDTVKKGYIKIDILMNNAGLFPQNYEITKDKMEYYLQTNFVGHVLLTFLLFDMLDKNDSRIINLSSVAYTATDYKNDINIKEMYDLTKTEKKYYKNIQGKSHLYGNTKILMIYFSKFLQKLCEEKYTYIKSAAVHPGAVDTEFMRFINNNNFIITYAFQVFIPIMKYFFKTPIDGAQTQLNLCYIPFNEFISGGYYSDCKVRNIRYYANDMNKAMECMKLTIEEIKKRFPDTKIFDILGDIFNKKQNKDIII